MDRIILHCDMNAFYASVELLKLPHLANEPVAVCGDPQARHGIILAKNEAAKSFGVVTAETIWSARKKCPQLILLGAHHDKYQEYCGKINNIYCRFTDLVEAFSIDESWLDVTGSQDLFGDGREIADRIRATVKEELGLTLSVGVSFNKIFAKMGSDYKKPDATTLISRENYKELLWPLPVKEFFGVGAATAAKLAHRGITTIGDLARYDRTVLLSALGKMGGLIYDHANGIDDSPVSAASEKRRIKSVGKGLTFRTDISGEEQIRVGVTALADSVAGRLRKHGLKCHGVKVDIKDPYFKVISRQKQLPVPSDITGEIVACAMSIIRDSWKLDRPIRLITITGINLTSEDFPEQLSFLGLTGLPDINPGAMPAYNRVQAESIDHTVDEIRRRYGNGAIFYGNILNNDIGIELDTMSVEEGIEV